MKQSTKQRIVGSVVLLALALIFLPLVFDGQGSYQPALTSRIPEPAVVQTLPQPVPTRPVIRDTSNIDDQVEPIPIEPDPSAELTDFFSTEPDSEITVTVLDETNDQADGVPTSTDEPNTVPVVDSQADVVDVPPGLDEDGLPQGWSVRLGSFKQLANANNLLERLRTEGYKAYSRNIPSTQGELTGVFVGPWVDRATVEQYRRQLQEDFKLSGIVVRFAVDRL